MTITLIAAAAENNALGKDNKMLWHIPEDFKHFKKLTSGHYIIMGRKTFESLPGMLPNRTHVIITRQEDYKADGCIVVNSLEEALKACPQDEEVFIIGGGEIYKQAIDRADKIQLTRVHGISPEADAYFPEIDLTKWQLQASSGLGYNDSLQYKVSFQIWTKITDRTLMSMVAMRMGREDINTTIENNEIYWKSEFGTEYKIEARDIVYNGTSLAFFQYSESEGMNRIRIFNNNNTSFTFWPENGGDGFSFGYDFIKWYGNTLIVILREGSYKSIISITGTTIIRKTLPNEIKLNGDKIYYKLNNVVKHLKLPELAELEEPLNKLFSQIESDILFFNI